MAKDRSSDSRTAAGKLAGNQSLLRHRAKQSVTYLAQPAADKGGLHVKRRAPAARTMRGFAHSVAGTRLKAALGEAAKALSKRGQ